VSASGEISLPWLTEALSFPHPSRAFHEPNGLLAAGGDLKPERLLLAYQQGIFPWFNPGEPILWWSPDPRTVIFPSHIHLSRSLRKLLNKNPFTLTLDQDFRGVVQACSEPRLNQSGTWITDDMKNAYAQLHELGFAHSVECWQEDKLVGGLYGIALGQCFFGESMFSRADNASKVAITSLAHTLDQWGFKLIDCQVSSEHLYTLGAEDIPQEDFLTLLQTYIPQWTPHSKEALPSQVLSKSAGKWDSKKVIIP